jgi:hypothetical protein
MGETPNLLPFDRSVWLLASSECIMSENGWRDIHDEDCPSARPRMWSMDMDAAQVNKPISENWRVTIRDLYAVLEFSIRGVQHNDKEELGYCRVVARWVPRYVMEEYKNRRGIESRWGARFTAPVQAGPGAHPASCTMDTGSFPGSKYGRDVLLTTRPLLLPWSWKNRAIPLPTLWATPVL